MTTTLILNADASPISILPLSTISWQEAIRYMVTDKAVTLEWYDDWVVHSANWETRVPAVMMLTEFEKRKTAVKFAKSHVFLRDSYTCQYCGVEVDRKTATLDHVVPVSLGGKTIFENSTTACSPCNANKGNNHKIIPKVKPYKPTYWELVEKRKKLGWKVPHPSWVDYLQ